MTRVLTYSSLDLNNLVSGLCSRSTLTLNNSLIPDQVYDDWSFSMQIPTNFPALLQLLPDNIERERERERDQQGERMKIISLLMHTTDTRNRIGRKDLELRVEGRRGA